MVNEKSRIRSMRNSWRGMKERCLNVNSKAFKNYGGRGITVYQFWAESFSSFLYWCIKNGHRAGLELDRIDNNSGYSPSNCRFVTHTQNNRNKRNNRFVEYKGERKTMSEWIEIYGFNYKTLSNRINRGWGIDKAFETPIKNK